MKLPNKSKKDNEPYTIKTFFIDLIQVVGTALILTLLILLFVQPCIVSGTSMYPTYYDKDIILVWKHGDIERNDIIAFDSNNPDNELYIKRVIAIEGDHLVIKDSKVYVNDVLVDEPYINELVFSANVDTVIEPGHIFVMGDNRNHSTDSRILGQVDLEEVLGKVLINFNKSIRNLTQK
ncbi:MAG: signal peptidase I [Lachnospiraceae bacterium]|nr:signal peptidase I [Lachnospiraceae bacterium]